MSENIYMQLGEAFRQLRKKAKLSQKEISDKTGISQTEISKFESKGEEIRSVARVNTLLNALGFELAISEKKLR